MPPPQPNSDHQTQPLSRSPGRSRGRSRKAALARQPPPLAPLQRLKTSPYFLPAAVALAALILALLYSAIRISSNRSDAEYGYVTDGTGAPRPFAGARPAGSVKNGRVEILTNDQGNRKTPPLFGSQAGSDERVKDDGKVQGGQRERERNPLRKEELDAAVQHALEEAWHLPPHARDASSPSPGSTAPGEGAGEDMKRSEGKPRTLEELYAELDELGISAHELQEALDEGLREQGQQRRS